MYTDNQACLNKIAEICDGLLLITCGIFVFNDFKYTDIAIHNDVLAI